MTFEVFHFEISGKDINALHPLNIFDMLMVSEVFHFEILGNVFNNIQ